MAKKKQKYICEYASFCQKEFDTPRGLSIHKSRRNHWGKYTPKPPTPPAPIREHKNYFDLIKDAHKSWGQEMTKEEAKHPSREQLMLGALFVIIERLEELSAHLGKK